MLSCISLYATPWTVAHQAPLSMGLYRQEYLSGLPFPTPGDHPRDRNGVSCLLRPLDWHPQILSHSDTWEALNKLLILFMRAPCSFCNPISSNDSTSGIYTKSLGLPDPEIKPGNPILQANSLPSELPGKLTKVNKLIQSSKVAK